MVNVLDASEKAAGAPVSRTLSRLSRAKLHPAGRKVSFDEDKVCDRRISTYSGVG